MEEMFGRLLKEFVEKNIAYMALVWLVSQVVFYMGVGRNLNKYGKRAIVVIIGSIFGAGFIAYHYLLRQDVQKTIEYSVTIIIAFCMVILFHHLIYKQIMSRLEIYKLGMKAKKEG